MNKLNRLYNIIYTFAHYIKVSAKNGRRIFPSILLLRKYIIYNYYKINPIDLELPWISIDALKRIEKKLSITMKVFEFGSGGSTIFFSKYVELVCSVEHDSDWYDLVKSKLNSMNIQNVRLKLYQPSKILDATKKIHRSYTKKEFLNYNFYDYVNHIDIYPIEYFDLILIDGRSRADCLEVSVSKLNSGGILVFDNADRDEYQIAINKHLRTWKVEKYYGPTVGDKAFSETHIYIKP